MKYFKIVALTDPNWLASEFRDGRLRFGWSWPGSDLRALRDKSDLSDDEKTTWRYTQFLVQRLQIGDRVVCQFSQPLREFWIGEVVDPGYEFDEANRSDFNHIVHIRPITERPISSTAKFVSSALKYDLTKRGHYYEIYPESSISALDRIVEEQPWKDVTVEGNRTEAQELEESYLEIQNQIVSSISDRWRAKDFENFCAQLCESIPYVEVKTHQDSGLGWDILVRIMNPITGEVLLDDVPVQCKNHEGEVTYSRPVDDLERCIRNSESSIAYLFIIGALTPGFLYEVDRAAERLSEEFERKVTFVVVDQTQIANLYMRHVLGVYGQTHQA